MMETHLSLACASWARLREHLLQDGVEQAAIIFVRVEEVGTKLTLREQDIFLLQPSDFSYQSAFHIEMADDTQAEIIRKAWELGCAIVEIHSHVGSDARPEFSKSDTTGFLDFVPHVRWRLRGKPYVAIVITESGFDALVWRREQPQADPLHAVLTESAELRPSNLTLNQGRRASVRSI